MITAHGAAVSAVWPQITPRLRGFLRGRGLTEHDAEDIAQECALRALALEVPFEDVDDLMRWCLTVARNATVDLHRQRARLTSEIDGEHASEVDVHREVVARLELSSVASVWSRLSATDQQALVDAVECVPTPRLRREAVRLYVQRNRARQRLQSMLAVWVGVVLASWRTIRRAPLAPVVAGITAAVYTVAMPSASPHGPKGGADLDVARSVDPMSVGARVAPRTSVAPRGAPVGAAPAAIGSDGRRVIASAAGPAGVGARLESHDREAQDGGSHLVCVGDLPVIADTCVEQAPLP